MTAVAGAPAGLIRTEVGPRNAWTNESGLRHYRWRGTDLPSVTTIRRMAGVPFGLFQWYQTMIIERAINGYADLGKILAVGTDDATKAAGTWLRNAPNLVRDEAAGLGTRVHDAATTNKPITLVGSDVVPYLRQYQHWLAMSGAQIIAAEKQVFNLKVGYAGTFDLLIRLPDGSRWVVDIKTGKGLYTEHALQCMAYAMATFVGQDDIVDRRLTEELRAANGIAILHIGKTGWEWAEVKLTPDLWLAFRSLLIFARFIQDYPKIDPLVGTRLKGAA